MVTSRGQLRSRVRSPIYCDSRNALGDRGERGLFDLVPAIGRRTRPRRGAGSRRRTRPQSADRHCDAERLGGSDSRGDEDCAAGADLRGRARGIDRQRRRWACSGSASRSRWHFSLSAPARERTAVPSRMPYTPGASSRSSPAATRRSGFPRQRPGGRREVATGEERQHDHERSRAATAHWPFCERPRCQSDLASRRYLHSRPTVVRSTIGR